jgi:hypothetical protein
MLPQLGDKKEEEHRPTQIQPNPIQRTAPFLSVPILNPHPALPKIPQLELK